MNKLTPIHMNELTKNQGYTEYGIIVNDGNDIQGKMFTNSGSSITLDYEDLMERYDDEYQSLYINKNSMASPINKLSVLLQRFGQQQYQEFYNNYEKNFKKNPNEYLYSYMNCYSLVNIFNDFQVKPSKKIIILGFNGIILNFLSTIMYYASREKKFKISFFTVKKQEQNQIILQKWVFKNNVIKEDKCERSIKKIEHLRNYLVVCFCESQLNLVFPENCEINQYYSTRDVLEPQQLEGFSEMHKYTQRDFQDFLQLVNALNQLNLHNNSYDHQQGLNMALYFQKIPKFKEVCKDDLKPKKKNSGQQLKLIGIDNYSNSEFTSGITSENQSLASEQQGLPKNRKGKKQ